VTSTLAMLHIVNGGADVFRTAARDERMRGHGMWDETPARLQAAP
jgi:hypothetical protein